MIVDPHGRTLNPARRLAGVRAKEVRAKLADLDPDRLPSVAQARAELTKEKRERGPEIWNREAAERRREAELVDAAIVREIARQKEGEEDRAREAARLRREREREASRERWRFEGWANRKRAELQRRL